MPCDLLLLLLLKAGHNVKIVGNEVNRSSVSGYMLLWVAAGLCLRFAVPVYRGSISFSVLKNNYFFLFFPIVVFKFPEVLLLK